MRLLWGSCRFFVGDGFIRPEVCTLVNSGQATSINAERGNLGTDKSVPYKSLQFPSDLTNDLTNDSATRILKAWNADLHGLRGFCPRNLLNGNIFYHERIRKIRENPLNPCSATFNLHR
ncbi:MAG: hypothetical protein FWG87_08560 [Defluviitaleaceae bacterium]|nr:hypothetical protein [Defluviitaleaceae bacterium]